MSFSSLIVLIIKLLGIIFARILQDVICNYKPTTDEKCTICTNNRICRYVSGEYRRRTAERS